MLNGLNKQVVHHSLEKDTTNSKRSYCEVVGINFSQVQHCGMKNPVEQKL